jgi:phosphatidate cytidylyltransferase
LGKILLLNKVYEFHTVACFARTITKVCGSFFTSEASKKVLPRIAYKPLTKIKGNFMTTFQQRALTAIIFAAVMLVGLFWNDVSFLLLFFVISMGCLWEFLGMMLEKSLLRKILGMALGFMLALAAVTNSIWWNNPLVYVFLISPISLLIIELFLKSEKPFQNVGVYLIGVFYTIIPFWLIHHLSVNSKTLVIGGWTAYPPLSALPQGVEYQSNFTPFIIAGTLFLTWANDTFAYIIGSKIGKTPLLPRISPKKTWEGTMGGAVMCMMTGVVISFFFKELTLLNWMVVGGIVAIFGTLGDLIESMLKRSVGVKDSGSFMPGHGGFLDRFDAFIFAVPFVYLYLIVLK